MVSESKDSTIVGAGEEVCESGTLFRALLQNENQGFILFV